MIDICETVRGGLFLGKKKTQNPLNLHHLLHCLVLLYLFAGCYEDAVGGRIFTTCSNQKAVAQRASYGGNRRHCRVKPFTALYFKVANF